MKNKTIKHFSKQTANYLSDKEYDSDIIWEEAEILTAELYPEFKNSEDIVERFYHYICKYLKVNFD